MTQFKTPKLDTMTLGAGHSILVGRTPTTLNSQSFSDPMFKASKIDTTLSSFGLFGSDIDYNTYYPDVKPEELTPSDDEFINPIYRMLSECVVNKNSYYPTDFSKNGVLKASMPLLLGQTVNCDHETNIGNAIGSIANTSWQESYEADGGIFIPAGINAQLKIDGKSNPRIARGITMTPPSIHSNSVTVKFSWDKSHPDMSDDDFLCKLGGYDENGQMIVRVVTNIIAYLETSLVSHGADPFAQLINENGQINNPTYASQVYGSFSADQLKEVSKRYIFIDYKNDCKIDTLHNNNTIYINNISNKENQFKKRNEMTELENFLQTLFGDNLLSLGENTKPSTDLVMASIKTLISDKSSLTESLSLKDSEITLLKEKQLSLEDKSLIELGKSATSSLRESTIATYKKVADEKADESVISLLTNADFNTLQTLGKTYQTQLDEKFPVVCKQCGSKEVTRASSIEQQENKEKVDEPKTTENVINSFRIKGDKEKETK